ncbi:hypothetical protein [Chromobacterium paludis]|uniref:Uncharacterized protein n=1 Tax=Chromobacterium paludis TaxID=2605945 RepID=A0A5C1DDN4_9NEIS|nr:hypothetical protein [Chromobacterium paludis]QEL54862.1 hypothetical protein FYK34_04410 [Chromobacterium paludis]
MFAERLETIPVLPHDIEVLSTTFTCSGVDVVVQSGSSRNRWRIHFDGAIGLRVLDEGDLLEFWPVCSSQNGRIFRILSGGWKDQEFQREGFLCRETNPNLPEYFVAGQNHCVSVLSDSPPDILEIDHVPLVSQSS